MRLTQAQIARIRSLEDKRGRISARRVVEEAQKPSSPLHKLFEWDTAKAAMRHWLHQARQIIGTVTVQVTHQDRIVASPCYVHLPGEAEYQRVDVVQQNPAQSQESLVYTLEVAAGHLRRAYDLAAPLGLSRQIDRLLEQVVGVQRLANRKKAA